MGGLWIAVNYPGLVSWSDRFLFGREPSGEVDGREDAEVSVHSEVSGSAELGAEDGVGAGDGWGEVEMDGLAGDGVLL